VFLSSHLMSEMAQTADQLIVIGRGRLIADTSVAEFVRRASSDANVRVRSPQAGELRDALGRARHEVEVRVEVESIEEGLLEVSGLSGEQIGEIALAARIVISELTPQQASLEEAFMSLTGEAVEYRGGSGEGEEGNGAGEGNATGEGVRVAA
jgi:ABC-2 type transport system ATP-binding protein